jgi:hypothetical protein
MKETYHDFNLEARVLLLAGLVLFAFFIFLFLTRDTSEVEAPWAFDYLRYTPRFLSNALYAWDTIGIVGRGYLKVRCTVTIPRFLVTLRAVQRTGL